MSVELLSQLWVCLSTKCYHTQKIEQTFPLSRVSVLAEVGFSIYTLNSACMTLPAVFINIKEELGSKIENYVLAALNKHKSRFSRPFLFLF